MTWGEAQKLAEILYCWNANPVCGKPPGTVQIVNIRGDLVCGEGGLIEWQVKAEGRIGSSDGSFYPTAHIPDTLDVVLLNEGE